MFALWKPPFVAQEPYQSEAQVLDCQPHWCREPKASSADVTGKLVLVYYCWCSRGCGCADGLCCISSVLLILGNRGG